MTRRLLFAHDDKVSFQNDGQPVSYNYTRQLVDRYRYLADEVTFAIRGDAPEPIAWFEDATIVCLPDMKHGKNILSSGAARRRVSELVAAHDIVVARLPSLIGSWALKSAWRLNKPVLVEFVGCPWDALWNHSLKGKVVAPHFWAKNRRLMERATHAIYVTEEFLQRRYPSSATQIACSNVEVELAPDADLRRRLSRLDDLRLSARPIVLGTVANLDVPYKGHDLVIRALASLGSLKEQFVYRLIGPGDPDRLKRLAADLGVIDQLDITGPYSHEKVPAALDDIDIYLQPSRQEGLPRAVIEAMARGCVVIGSGAGGIPELISEPWIVERGDWKAIAALLMHIDRLPILEAAARNHLKASEFRMKDLEVKRRNFYDQFLVDHNLSPAHDG